MYRTQRLRILALSLLAGAVLWLPGCDNPACVFGGNCFGGSGNGALGSSPASSPADNEWVTLEAPSVSSVFPNGSTTVDSRTPIMVTFSESMSTSGMSTLFLLQGSNGAPQAYVTALIGDGRVLVLLPATTLTADEAYTLSYNPNANVQDHNGQPLVVPSDPQLASFTVSASNSNTPKLVATWPPDNAINQGGKGEILALFDRPLDATTLDASSFHVQLGGVDLPDPIEPLPLALAGGVATDTRVVRWRRVDTEGNPLALGLNAAVTIELSPSGHVILDEATHPVAHATFDYHTAAFGSPTAGAITSDPDDAIGIDAISGPENLAVRVELDGAQDGDHLVTYLFGTEPDVLTSPKLISLVRDVKLVAPFTDFTLTAAELELRASLVPLKARFAEGTLHFAFQLRRGNLLSPVKLLDVDATQSGEQAPVLDITPPTLLGLGPSGTVTSSYTSDMRDLVVVGRASEALRAVTVETALGDNTGGGASAPTVAGANGSGLFVARPVPLGIVDPAQLPLSFDLTLYDRALNRAGPLTSSFQQTGTVGPGNTSYTEIAVRVFDANTRAPLAGAQVHTHEWDPLLLNVFSVADLATDANGFVLMPASRFGGRNILTVDAAGYELFTFDGVTVDRVDVPLHPLLDAGATVEGTVSATAPEIALYTNLVADSRLDHPGQSFEPVGTCSFTGSGQLLDCPYDPYPILPHVIGAQSAFAIFPPPSVLLYTAAGFLKAATLELPVSPASSGAAVVNDQSHRMLLDDPSLDPELAAIDAPPVLLTSSAYPSLAADPVVSVEALSPGMPGSVVVGVGKAFTDALPPGSFAVRAAYPGSVDGIQDSPTDLLGDYVVGGTIEADLRLHMQVEDSDGNLGGVRPRLSSGPVAEDPPAAADLGVIPIELDGLGLADTLWFTDVLPDSVGQPGLYKVVLTDVAGGRWVIWTTDPPDVDGPEVPVRLPLIGSGLGFPLAAGDLDCRISLYAWPALDTANFLWSDVEREYALFSRSKPLVVTPP
ncbi:MAG: Ig-like domain-containing protein [Planctomycetes bacterium]|nr:Ig-like domain-containing protein [Planctomycetota bacterium]